MMSKFHINSFFSILLIFGLICVLIIPKNAFSSENYIKERKVWILFTDKGLLSNNEDIDMPVYQPYINEIISLGAKHHISSKWLNAITITANEETLKKIAKLPYIKAIDPIITYKSKRPKPDKSFLAPSSPKGYYGISTTQITQIHANVLHDKGYHGEGVTIAILDTGFNLSHVSLRNVKVLAEYDFINNDDITSDQHPQDDIGQDDHGTEVLSIIAGNDPERFVGIAHSANFLLAKTEKVSEGGLMFEMAIEEDWWVAGLEWAVENGADIVSSSLGYSDWYSYSNMNGRTAKTTIAANIATEKGIIVVVSAGNDGKSNESPYISAPADGFDVIAVGSVNEFGELSDFSSIGPTYDGRIKPDLVAMGEGTFSADPSNINAYRKVSGTSMSTPLVAGTIALLKQALPEISRNKMLVKLLKYTATQALNPNNRYGWGLINAESAYRYAKFPGNLKELENWDPNGSISVFDGVSIYPNPIKIGVSKNIINIHSPKPIRNVRIYDITGLLIYRRLDLDDARFLTWNLTNDQGQRVSSGVYICLIEFSEGIYERRKIAVIR